MQVQYNSHCKLYELHEMDQPIIVVSFLSLGGTGFVYSAIPSPLMQTALNRGENHKTTSTLPKLWPWHP